MSTIDVIPAISGAVTPLEVALAVEYGVLLFSKYKIELDCRMKSLRSFQSDQNVIILCY